MRSRLQKAITMTIKNHPGLGNKAFIVTESGDWTVRPDVTQRHYSNTEAMLVGLLIELYQRCHGLPFKWDENEAPSMLIWSGAKNTADLFTCFDDQQQSVIKALVHS